MHTLYLLVQTYPFWAIPCALVLFELAIFFRRNSNPTQFVFWGAILGMMVLLGLWIYYRGDINSGRWIRSIRNFG